MQCEFLSSTAFPKTVRPWRPRRNLKMAITLLVRLRHSSFAVNYSDERGSLFSSFSSGPLAQLVRAPFLHSGSRLFESDTDQS